MGVVHKFIGLKSFPIPIYNKLNQYYESFLKCGYSMFSKMYFTVVYKPTIQSSWDDVW